MTGSGDFSGKAEAKAGPVIKDQPKSEPMVAANQPGLVPRYVAKAPGDSKPVPAQEFIYVGDNPSVVAYGITFEKGKAVKVTDPFIIGKLSNNHEFTDGSDKDRLKEAQRLNLEADKAKGEAEARTKAEEDRRRNQRV